MRLHERSGRKNILTAPYIARYSLQIVDDR